jgi:hypothetical protein
MSDVLSRVEDPQLTNHRSPEGSYSAASIPDGVWAENEEAKRIANNV